MAVFPPERREAEPLEKLHLARDDEQFFDTPCGGQGFTLFYKLHWRTCCDGKPTVLNAWRPLARGGPSR